MPNLFNITSDGTITAGSNDFQIAPNGDVTLNRLLSAGDFISCDAALVFPKALGPVVTSPNGTQFVIKVTDSGVLSAEPYSP